MLTKATASLATIDRLACSDAMRSRSLNRSPRWSLLVGHGAAVVIPVGGANGDRLPLVAVAHVDALPGVQRGRSVPRHNPIAGEVEAAQELRLAFEHL